MLTKSWYIIKDDSTRTFEVVDTGISENSFSNRVVTLQRAGFSVTPIIVPVSNRHASKEHISFTGYTREEGLYERLHHQQQKLMKEQFGEWEE
jgi:hypothetical protein